MDKKKCSCGKYMTEEEFDDAQHQAERYGIEWLTFEWKCSKCQDKSNKPEEAA